VIWPKGAGGREAAAAKNVGQEVFSIDGKIERATDVRRAEWLSPRVERDCILVHARERCDDDAIALKEGNRARRDVGHHVHVPTEQARPGGAKRGEWSDRDPIDIGLLAVVAVKTLEDRLALTSRHQPEGASPSAVLTEAERKIEVLWERTGRSAERYSDLVVSRHVHRLYEWQRPVHRLIRWVGCRRTQRVGDEWGGEGAPVSLNPRAQFHAEPCSLLCPDPRVCKSWNGAAVRTQARKALVTELPRELFDAYVGTTETRLWNGRRQYGTRWLVYSRGRARRRESEHNRNNQGAK
jgi:hypothetical protein